MLSQVITPLPKDIPLELPLHEWLLVILLIVSFLFHIVFINLMVGGSILGFWAQIKGLKNNDYDSLAHEIAKTITVNKSLAVVLGVAPLLSINALYTIYFYSANALTGFAWIMIIPLVTIAFLLTYLHKYTWESLSKNKILHISIQGFALLIFLFIPLIFLTNVNLMMFPEKWGSIHGFISALILPNVIPRYFEFIGSCISITGLFFIWYNNRKSYPVEKIYVDLNRHKLKTLGFTILALGILLQIFFGIIVLFTLPSKGLGYDIVILMILTGTVLTITLWLCYKSLARDLLNIDKHFKKIFLLMILYMLLYGSGRQMYRYNSLNKHQNLMKAHTLEFEKLSKDARENQIIEIEADSTLGEFAKGASIFQKNCSACHKRDEKLVGPPIKEMVSIYINNKIGLKKWIKEPGKKRNDFPQMPGFPNLNEEELNELSKFILSTK